MENINNYDLFDPVTYIQDYYLEDGAEPSNRYYFTKLKEYFQSGLLKGRYMLEIGTGPVPIVSMYATEHYEEFYLSDYGKKNIEFLRSWKDKEQTHLLRPIFQTVASKLNDGLIAENIENSLRNKVQSICHCDVMQPHPIVRVEVPKFDLVAAAYCIDEAATDLQKLHDVYVKISDLLKPGGYFLYFDDDATFYELNGQSYQSPTLPGPSDRIKILQEAGFEIIEWSSGNVGSLTKTRQIYNCENSFSFLVQKR